VPAEDSSLIFSRPPLVAMSDAPDSDFAAGTQVGDDLVDAHLVDQPQRCIADAQGTQRFSVSSQKRRYCRFGRKRRLVRLLAWETEFPTIGRLPVT
jgi:hypothetical protein